MTDRESPGRDEFGTMRAVDGMRAVLFERHVAAPITEVWSAITDPRRLESWLGDFEGELREGGEFTARFSASGWEGTGRIAACDPPRRLQVWLRGEEQPDERPSEVRLEEQGDGTILYWEERGLPLEYLAGFGAGIHIHVEDLDDHLCGRERREAMPRFERLFAAYKKRLALGS